MPRIGDSLTGIWCVIPVYNNGATIAAVASACRQYIPRVMIVDDGSTDCDLTAMFKNSDINVVRHQENRGKGAALLTALEQAAQANGEYMLTIDGDGQHFPDDLPKFLPLLAPGRIIIGERVEADGTMPRRSRFGRRFSDFWITLETGQLVSDSQSGFRAYPVDCLLALPLRGRRYDFEIEVLARAAWAGLSIVSVPVKVRYAPPGERVSSFRPFVDNLRISLAHTRLIGRRLVPWPSRRLFPKPVTTRELLEHPSQVFMRLFREAATPTGLAASAAVGIFLGALPLIGIHMAAVFYVTLRLRLNKVMALAVQNLCMPPVVPGICIALGFFLRHGHAITDVPFRQLASAPGQRFLEWWLGALLIAPLLAIVTGPVVYFLARATQKRMKKESIS